MSALETLEWWKNFARTHNRAGGDNYVPAGAGTAYIFDAHPKQFENGALQGHVFRKDAGGGVQDLGIYKIGPDGKVVTIPDEVAPYLTAAPADRRMPCPDCPDGNAWTLNGPSEQACPRCKGKAYIVVPA